MNKIKQFLKGVFKRTNRLHTFQVQFSYKDQDGKQLFHWFSTVGLVKKADILSSRKLLLAGTAAHSYVNKDPDLKRLLCNGTMYTKVICYMGKVDWSKNK